MTDLNHSSEQHETSCERKQQTNEKEFDPYDYGKEDGIGRWEAAIHLYRYSMGSNIILMPYIIKNLGWLLGALSILGTSVVLYHITHVLISTEYKICKRLKLKRLSHIELVGKVFKISPYPLNKLCNPMRLVMFIYYATPLSTANVLIVMSNGIQTLAKFFDLELKTTLILTILIIPLSIISMFQKIIKILVPFSLVTSIFTLCVAVIIVVNSVVHREDNITVITLGDVRFIPKSAAMFLSIVNVCFPAMAIKNNMVEPQKLVSPFGALNIAAVGAVAFIYSFGVISYISYGDRVCENILWNMPQESYLSFSVIFLYTISLSVNYLLIFFGRIDNLWTNSLKDKFGETKYASVLEYCIRIALNLTPYFLAVVFPDIIVISTLLGLSNIIMNVALPAVLELLYLLTDKKKNCWIIFKDIFIIGASAFVFIVSLNGCIEKIKKIYKK